jgi:hypothetical protein
VAIWVNVDLGSPQKPGKDEDNWIFVLLFPSPIALADYFDFFHCHFFLDKNLSAERQE